MDTIFVAPPVLRLPDPAGPADPAEVLRQLLDVQREHLGLVKQQLANQDERAKWRTFHGRHADQFPDLPAACKRALPAVERAYLGLLAEFVDRLAGDDPVDLDSEFAVAELLDRYAGRLLPLGQLVGMVGQMATVAPPDPT